MSSFNDILKALYADNTKGLIPQGVRLVSMLTRIEDWTVEQWIKHGNGTDDWEKYPNAVAAKKIMDSKLYKAMK